MNRVLYIESAPQAGGSTVSLFELVRRLNRQEYDPVILLCSSNPYRECFTAAGISVLTTAVYCAVRTPTYPGPLAQARSSSWANCLRANRVGKTIWRAGGLAVRTVLHTWPLALEVRRIVCQQKIALVHLNDAPALHKAGIIGSRLAGVPCICHVRSMPALDILDRLLVHLVAHFVFISQAVERDQRQQGIGQRPGTVIYNALDVTQYRNLDRKKTRQAFGLADNEAVIGMMGRIEPWKGQRDLLLAVSILQSQFPHLRCLIAGTPELDGAWYQDELVQLTDKLGLGSIVQFVGYQNPLHFLPALDVLVHASVQPEPFGRVLIEGMAAGLPIVATNAGGVPEIVVDGETGLLVPPGQPEALAAAITRLLANPSLARKMGERGQARAAALFSIEGHVATIEAIYRQIIGSRV